MVWIFQSIFKFDLRNDVYNLKVRGQLLNNTWTNYAFRFIAYTNNNALSYINRGGLEVIRVDNFRHKSGSSGIPVNIFNLS